MVIEPVPPSRKGPRRYGSIKNELRNRFVFVYGTEGNAEEDAWTFAKARFDAETLWYRGNGSVDMIPDVNFIPDDYLDRNVVLYGNVDVNSVWNKLLPNCPVQVYRDRIEIGERAIKGHDLATLFVQPRPDSDTASVIAVGGTGVDGLRLVVKQSLFVPFIRYPDCIVMSGNGLDTGKATVIAAGYFGTDWSVAAGEFQWNKASAHE